MGSSGALVAAVFDNYSTLSRERALDDIDRLKFVFSIMESHFHGASSGIDPLISYLNSPIQIIKGKTTKAISVEHPYDGANLFLLNTGRPRRTEPLVNLFLEKIKSHNFSKTLRRYSFLQRMLVLILF